MFQACLFMLRRFALALCLVFWVEHPTFQLMTFQFSSLFMMMFQGQFMPYITRAQNRMELFNESLVLMSSYHLFLFGDFVRDADTFYKIGYSLVFIIFLCVIINFGTILIDLGLKALGGFNKYQNFRAYKKKLTELKGLKNSVGVRYICHGQYQENLAEYNKE